MALGDSAGQLDLQVPSGRETLGPCIVFCGNQSLGHQCRPGLLWGHALGSSLGLDNTMVTGGSTGPVVGMVQAKACPSDSNVATDSVPETSGSCSMTLRHQHGLR